MRYQTNAVLPVLHVQNFPCFIGSLNCFAFTCTSTETTTLFKSISSALALLPPAFLSLLPFSPSSFHSAQSLLWEPNISKKQRLVGE